ncbi:MAG: ATP-dependent DNA helicase [Candidatus Nanohaloarchaea archaeon]|nr:ATP-dependent DNA helicase [Candidatus Nanohaloarchaea archaeon]
MQDLFPYSQVRDSQSQLKQDVEQALEDGGNVVAHAPTGLGKTAATLPQCLAYGLENGKTTFFLTPRHSQHEIAVETLQEVKEEHGATFRAVDLIGKRWLCEGEQGGHVYLEGEEDEKCPRHDNTYDENHQLTERAQRKIVELKHEILRAEEIKERCDKVCPYEILMHMAADADVVVGDYFHIFHPGVREAIFAKSELSLSDCLLIVDEAHNLPGRTRSLNSAVVTERMLDRGATEASRMGYYDEESMLERLQEELQRMAKHELGMEREAEIDKQAFMDRVADITGYDTLVDNLGSVAKEVRDEGDESTCGDIANFLDRWKGEDEGFVRVLERVQPGHGDAYLKLSYACLDPQFACREPMNQSHTSIAMSGTLTPVDMYMDLFGLDEDETYAETFGSPFPEENQLNLVVDKVTTRYKKRGDDMFQKIAWYILKTMEHVDGNVGIFFPSYDLRDKVHKRLKDRTDTALFLEDRRMDKEEKKDFLDRFAEKTDEGAALLGVVGGSFGEGVDFPGQLMSGVFIVGLPLQRPDLKTEALIDFYDEKFGQGWDYAYNYPAVNRALQAAGRCIRSEDDRGVIVFMDERYKWGKYRKAMPPGDYRATKAPWQDVRAFFGG